MTKLTLTIVAVLSTACAGTPRDHIQAIGFSDREVEILQAAANEWCEVSYGAYCTEITTAPSEHTITSLAGLPNNYAGYCYKNPLTGNFELSIKDQRTDLGSKWEHALYLITIHELGHMWDYRMDHMNGTLMGAVTNIDAPEWAGVQPPAAK